MPNRIYYHNKETKEIRAIITNGNESKVLDCTDRQNPKILKENISVNDAFSFVSVKKGWRLE